MNPFFCHYQINTIHFNFQTRRMNISMDVNINFSTQLSTEEADNLGSRVLTAWCVVFSVEAALLISGNLYAFVVIVRGYFDLVRYFTVSLAFTEIIRGFTAFVIVISLLHSDKLGCRVDYHQLFQTLQTLCDAFTLSFLAAISLDMYYRTFWPLTHKLTRVRCYMTTNFLIWILSMAITMTYAFALAGFYRLLIADVAVWFVEIIDLTVIFTDYILIWLKPKCRRNSPVWRLEKQNFELSKVFSLCAITYLAIWLPVQILQGISHFHAWTFPCNAVYFMTFLKMFCSFVCPAMYYMNLSPLHRSCTCRCTLIRHKHTSIIPPDSLPVITLKSASYLMTAL